MNRVNRATVEFSLCWQSEHARHVDRLYVEKIDFWRDSFPGDLGTRLALLEVGESCRQEWAAGSLVRPFRPRDVLEIRAHQFEGSQGERHVAPAIGRFYPRGLAWSALNCFPQSLEPFRLVDRRGDVLSVDLNHPLAHRSLTLQCLILHRLAGAEERGGSCNDIAELVTENGPGMQVPHPGAVTEFFSSYPFSRSNGEDDRLFYASPRFVQHLDDMAISRIEALHARLLQSGTRILDLMGSWTSHLPGGLERIEVLGLGMNEEELQANRRLAGYLVHDLNQLPKLPLADDSFDAVICTASVEYLAHPLAVFAEVARITRPGGIVLMTFSDRWFPGKEIELWAALHPFERMGLVLEYFRQTEAFTDLNTETVRGLPRPMHDRHFRERDTSDPIFAVWGTVRA